MHLGHDLNRDFSLIVISCFLEMVILEISDFLRC